jgi:hypothetical protein
LLPTPGFAIRAAQNFCIGKQGLNKRLTESPANLKAAAPARRKSRIRAAFSGD